MAEPWLVASQGGHYRSSRGYIPRFGEKCPDRHLAYAFLHTKFVIEKVIAECARVAIHAVDSDAIAVTIRADQTHCEIVIRDSAHRCPIWWNHVHSTSICAPVIEPILIEWKLRSRCSVAEKAFSMRSDEKYA
jgi:hypothetical protein